MTTNLMKIFSLLIIDKYIIFRKVDEASEQKIFVSSSNFHIHPSYNQNNLDNDIAVICLPYAATLNNEVNIACLPTGSASEVTNNCYATGKRHVYTGAFIVCIYAEIF